ncbi:hypothetical protein BGZ49_008159 [Haplosporangium sp. Z 27]|nr:hypothetical protein BGZ49_008159 [Haplosporangium sp. Z 27]
MIRNSAVRHASIPHSSCTSGITSNVTSQPIVLTRSRRRACTHATVSRATMPGFASSSSTTVKPVTTNATHTFKSSMKSSRYNASFSPAVSNRASFSTSASLKKKHTNSNSSVKSSSINTNPKAATGVKGDVLYRKEGSKIVPVNPADQVEAPISSLFSQFEELSKPSSPEVTPIKKDSSTGLDLSTLTVKDVLPADEFVEQLISQQKFNITLGELKEEIQKLLNILTLPENDPTRHQTKKEFWKTCKKKNIDAYNLASFILKYTRDGAPVTLEIFKITVDNGDYLSKYSYGTMLYRGARGVPANPAKGRAIIESLAKPTNNRMRGLPIAMSSLAGMYARDDKNYEAARDMYLAAADKGVVEARVSLGRMYLSGELPQDPAMARKCFEQAIKEDDDNAEAHFLLGSLELASLTEASGEEAEDAVKKRVKQKNAFQHYQKAASKGLPEAQYNVGLAYFRGQGVPKNDALAIEYWKMSGQQGFGLAQLSLGAYYFQDEQSHGEAGTTVANQGWDPSKKDLMQAQKWFTLASRRPGTLGQEGQRLKAQVDEAIKKGGGRSKNGRFCTIM